MKYLIVLLMITNTARAALVADYNFSGDLSGSLAGAPEMIYTGETLEFAQESPFGFDSQVVLIEEGFGLDLPLAGFELKGVYSLVLFLRLENINGYRKLIDYNNLAGDPGVYVKDAQLNLYPIDIHPSATWQTNKYTQLVMTRDATSQVKLYQDGVLLIDANDGSNVTSLNSTDSLHFMLDDAASSGVENSAGAVARIMVFDEVLNQQQIDNLGIVDVIFASDFDD